MEFVGLGVRNVRRFEVWNVEEDIDVEGYYG